MPLHILLLRWEAVRALYIPKTSHRKSTWSDVWVLLLMFKNSECCSLVGGGYRPHEKIQRDSSVFVVQEKGFSNPLVLRHAQRQGNSEGDIACIRGVLTMVALGTCLGTCWELGTCGGFGSAQSLSPTTTIWLLY